MPYKQKASARESVEKVRNYILAGDIPKIDENISEEDDLKAGLADHPRAFEQIVLSKFYDSAEVGANSKVSGIGAAPAQKVFLY